MALSLSTILQAVNDRLESYYWTPKIITVTVGAVTTAQTFQLIFGGIKTASITATGSDTATTIAAALVTDMQLRQDNAQFGDLTVSSAAGVITITGGAYNFTSPTTAGSGSLTVATTQAASEKMFRDVNIVPMVDVQNIGKQLRNHPGALIFAGSDRRAEAGQNVSVATMSVLVVNDHGREAFKETALKGSRQLIKMVEAVKKDLYYRTDLGSSSALDLELKWNMTGSPGYIMGPDKKGWIGQEIEFEVEYVDVGV